MRNKETPSLATWILEHLVPGTRNEALSGDLLEEFQSGRSVGWYWRQVLAAVVSGYYRKLHDHLLPLTFALVWTIPAPFWWNCSLRLHAHFMETVASLRWPYSLMLDLFEPTSAFLFVWAGFVSYLSIYAISRRSFRVERVFRGLWIGPAVFIAVALVITLVPRPQRQMLMTQHLVALARMPYLFSLLAATWGVRPRAGSSAKEIDTN